VIGSPSAEEDDLFHLELYQFDLAIGGDALADSLVVMICRIAMNAQVLATPAAGTPSQNKRAISLLASNTLTGPDRDCILLIIEVMIIGYLS
jgi:hypothetical protein